jgi:hypothetical protein
MGEMQLRAGRWLPFEAEQDVCLVRVEFAWQARFQMAPLVSIRVRDWYADGDGGLEGRLFGLIPVARAGGADTARSEAMRYLAELAWFPHAIVANRELEWRSRDADSVEVATPVGRTHTAAVTIRFDEDGDIDRVFAPDRPRQEQKEVVNRPWAGYFSEYHELEGVRVPTRAEVMWELPEGPFPYFRARITGLELL